MLLIRYSNKIKIEINILYLDNGNDGLNLYKYNNKSGTITWKQLKDKPVLYFYAPQGFTGTTYNLEDLIAIDNLMV